MTAAYVKITNFAIKDGLATSDPLKIVKGEEIDDEFNAIATATAMALAKDGSVNPTADIPLANHKLTGVSPATARTDAATLANIVDKTGVYIGTVGGTADVITLTPSPAITAYAAGQEFSFIASGGNTTNVTVNISGLGAKALTKNGSTALIAGDIPSGSKVKIWYDGTRFQLGTTGAATAITAAQIPSNVITAIKLATSAIPNVPILNGYIEWSTSGNALTAAVKTLAGTDPSATDPVYVRFRDPTLGTAGYFIRSITAALSVTASSGSTLGTVSAQASRIRALFMDNAGTVVLGLYNSWNNTTKSLLALDDSQVYSSTAEGGAGAADSAQVIYTTSAQTSKAIAECGYVESTQTTAGTWAQTLDRKVTAGVGYRRTGDVVQEVTSSSGALITGTTVIPSDDTIPQNTEGVALTALDTAITPQSACNLVSVSVNVAAMASSAASPQNYTLALFEDSVANALASSNVDVTSANYITQPSINNYKKIVNTASSKTFKARAGSAQAGTTSFNGSAGTRSDGGVLGSNMTVKEIFV